MGLKLSKVTKSREEWREKAIERRKTAEAKTRLAEKWKERCQILEQELNDTKQELDNVKKKFQPIIT